MVKLFGPTRRDRKGVERGDGEDEGAHRCPTRHEVTPLPAHQRSPTTGKSRNSQTLDHSDRLSGTLCRHPCTRKGIVSFSDVKFHTGRAPMFSCASGSVHYP